MRRDIEPLWSKVVMTDKGYFCAFVAADWSSLTDSKLYEFQAFGHVGGKLYTTVRYMNIDLEVSKARASEILEELIAYPIRDEEKTDG